MTSDELRMTNEEQGSGGAGEQGGTLRVAVVGPCASGKSTLVAALREAGYEARHPAQEHSYVKDMWRQLVDPDVLIYLDISYEALLARRPHFGEREYLEREKARLAHAREHADLVVDTSGMTSEGVRERVLEALAFKMRDLPQSQSG
jgi:dephospho-CoA kinase